MVANVEENTDELSTSNSEMHTGHIIVQIRPEDPEQWGETRESSLPYFVIPLHYFFHYAMGLTSTPLFTFNSKTAKFTPLRTSKFHKALGLVLVIMATLYTYALGKLEELYAPNNTMFIFTQFVGHCRFAYGLICHLVITIFSHKICNIFNEIQAMTSLISQSGLSFPSERKVRIMASVFITLGLLMMLWNTMAMLGGRTSKSFHSYARKAIATNAKAIYMLTGRNVTTENNNGLTQDTIIAAGILLFNWWTTIIWSSGFLVLSSWTIVFLLLLQRFCQHVRASPFHLLVRDLRNFQDISRILDEFNSVFGLLTLLSVVGGAVHFSVGIYQVLISKDGLLQRSATIVSLCTYLCSLCGFAQVHRQAEKIAHVLNERFQNEALWAGFYGNSQEATQGMVLTLHAIQTSSVGIKGMDFFTCSYAFIGTVMSAISTYAVIVIQFQSS